MTAEQAVAALNKARARPGVHVVKSVYLLFCAGAGRLVSPCSAPTIAIALFLREAKWSIF